MVKKENYQSTFSAFFSTCPRLEIVARDKFFCVLVKIVHRFYLSNVRTFFFEHVITHSLFVCNNVKGYNALLLLMDLGQHPDGNVPDAFNV